jgi:hypothetical protein
MAASTPSIAAMYPSLFIADCIRITSHSTIDSSADEKGPLQQLVEFPIGVHVFTIQWTGCQYRSAANEKACQSLQL